MGLPRKGGEERRRGIRKIRVRVLRVSSLSYRTDGGDQPQSSSPLASSSSHTRRKLPRLHSDYPMSRIRRQGNGACSNTQLTNHIMQDGCNELSHAPSTYRETVARCRQASNGKR